jgi:hypothetical protein
MRARAIDVSQTNVRLSSRMNRFPNLTFHCGLIEEADRLLPPGAFDLAYAVAVLERVATWARWCRRSCGAFGRAGASASWCR